MALKVSLTCSSMLTQEIYNEMITESGIGFIQTNLSVGK